MATHSDILAWRIQWIEDPGRLHCIGLQRVRPNCSDLVLLGCSNRKKESRMVVAKRQGREGKSPPIFFFFKGRSKDTSDDLR